MPGANKQTQQTNQTTKPLAEAMPSVTGLLGGLEGLIPGASSLSGLQSGALNTLQANAQGGNPYASQIGGLATDLFGGGVDRTGMVTDALGQYQSDLAPTARGDYLDPNKNPWFGQVTSKIGDDVMNRMNSMFAGSGRDLSGAGSAGLHVGRGIAEGTAPLFAQAYDQERGRQLNAQQALYGAGSGAAGLLSGLDQTALGNRQAGVGASGAALSAENYGAEQQLAVEARRLGIPVEQLRGLTSVVQPLAALGTNTQGTTTTSTASNPMQALIGAGIAGVGLMSGNPMMAMSGLSGGMNGFNPAGSAGGNYFPGNAAAAGAVPGYMPGYGMYPMFR